MGRKTLSEQDRSNSFVHRRMHVMFFALAAQGTTSALVRTKEQSMRTTACESGASPLSTMKERGVARARLWRARGRDASPLVHAVSALTAGIASTLLLHPLDVVKTRLQVQGILEVGRRATVHSTVSAFRTIVKTEGWKALYSGLSANIIGNGVAWGSYFGLYSTFQRCMRSGLQSPDKSPPLMNTLIAGGCAGVLTSAATCPIWLLKTRLQAQTYGRHSNYRGLIHAVSTIMREEGPTGFYRGLVPALLGTSHGLVQIVAYEELKALLSTASQTFQFEPNFTHYLVAGGTAKLVAGVTTYPYQVVKARLQVRSDEYRRFEGSRQVVQWILRNEGVVGFYRGIGPSVMRVIPGAAVVFATYEQVRSWLEPAEVTS